MISYQKIVGYNKAKEGVKCMIFNYYYFKDKFDYEPYVCNKCHDFPMTVINLSDCFVLTIQGADYSVYISCIDKKEAVNIFKNSF